MSDIERVKEANDIIEVIGTRIALQRSGANFRGLCPFHSEKSPSFFVSETLQRYKCFGCGETGDVFTFLEKFEGMTFAEALRTLADRAGITLTSFKPDRDEEQRRTLLEILELAKEYYQYLLETHVAGEPARQYLKERGTTSESRKVFTLGYALPAWDGLTTFLTKKKKYDPVLVEQTGLILRRQGGGYYDRFRHRLMFPLRNHRGQVVGFSGRLLAPLPSMQAAQSRRDDDFKEPKYINTPETLLYHKGQMLYGYSELLQEIRKRKEIVLVEGEFDVISSSQAHVSYVGGLKGSALTTDHVKLLARTVDKVILSLDADAAGIEATKRAVKVVKETAVSRATPLELRVIPVVGGKDPDEVAKTDPKAWRAMVKSSVPAYEFLIRTACQQQDVTTPSGKTAVIYEVAPLLADMAHAVEREHYLQLLAQWLNVSTANIERDVKAISERKLQQTGERVAERKPQSADHKPTRRNQLERYALFLWTHAKPTHQTEATTTLRSLSLIEAGANAVLNSTEQVTFPFTLATFSKQLPDDLQQRLFEWHTQPEYEVLLENLDWQKEWRQIIDDLKEVTRQENSKAIAARLAELDEIDELTPDQQLEQQELLRQLAALSSRMMAKSS